MFLAGFLAVWIGIPAEIYGQQAPPPAAQQPAATETQATPAPTPPAATLESLKILVLQGQNAVNNVTSGAATMPVVEVHDENDQVLEGADVTFELPATGPGGTFPGGLVVKTVKPAGPGGGCVHAKSANRQVRHQSYGGTEKPDRAHDDYPDQCY